MLFFDKLGVFWILVPVALYLTVIGIWSLVRSWLSRGRYDCDLAIWQDLKRKVENWTWEFKQAHKAQLYKCQMGPIWRVATAEEIEIALKSNKAKTSVVERFALLDPPRAMVFSSNPHVPYTHLTGNEDQMEDLLKDCKVMYLRDLRVPRASFEKKEKILQTYDVVSLDEAKQIIHNARPKLVRNFIRKYRNNLQAVVVGLVGLVLMAGIVCAQQWYYGTGVVQVSGDRVYAVGYHTRYGYVPSDRTFEKLKDDPAVWGIIWTEKTNDPDTELWWDYQCGQGFWANRCEFVSEGRVVHLSQLGK